MHNLQRVEVSERGDDASRVNLCVANVKLATVGLRVHEPVELTALDELEDHVQGRRVLKGRRQLEREGVAACGRERDL